ncbi:hypothetical protein AMS68_001954 [Peltaster fructicola]|uniref:Uncharacterized protein n=1 Tax=Peltaster fructicola TaxID=286661 RepID=A0A6H0XNV0_9PEZI|nr:hypothetical protein AMS68_001954 [Peltaster fructicola]
MRNIISQLIAVGPELAAIILSFASTTYAVTPSTVPSPNLDLSQLGRVAFGGDFDSISFYTYQGQSESSFSTNGSQALLTRYPDGSFRSLAMSDAVIKTMCPFIANNTLQGVVVGGNFTSLGGVQAQGVALYNPNTTTVTPLPGLSGKVSALYCDAQSGTVYVGGAFTAGNSTNAMSWTTGWTNLPFAGFNGPVTSIVKSAAGNIIFGGQFDGVGNATSPKERDVQVVNIGSGTVTSSGSTSTAGFSDPRNIICKVGSQDGSGNTWLLNDNTAGYWQGAYAFGFNPTKLRLYNTQYQGRGTKSFYFEDLNSGGILAMSYTGSDGKEAYCSSNCPLPQTNSNYTDFHFTPPIGMSTFRIQIVDWYGNGGGLAGIELFQDDIYSFAVNEFNEPQCDDVSQGSSSTFNGPWNQTLANGQSSSDYLTLQITNQTSLNKNMTVVFQPDLRQSGNYSITMYTPGCIQDNTCATRGQVNITGTMTTSGPPVESILYQTNNYDKFDQIYYGYVDVDTSTFRPSVTLTPVLNQNVPLTVVAQRVRFEIITSSGGLNGLFEYNPNEAVVNQDFSTSTINSAGAKLSSAAMVNAVVSYNQQLIVAGNFTGNGASNVMSIGSNATSLPGGGLDKAVGTVYQNGSNFYMGGNFTSTADKSVTGLNGLAVYDASSNKWSPIGAGVNGTVLNIVPLPLNISSGNPENCLAITGDFQSVNAYNGNSSFTASGFAVWVPSHSNWLQNLYNADTAVDGKLISTTDVPGFSTLYGGMINIRTTGQNDAVELIGSGQPSLQSLNIKIEAGTTNNTGLSKRSLGTGSNINTTGVYQALFYTENNLNVTVLGGSFTATSQNGTSVQNLAFINNTQSSQAISGVTGLDQSSIIVSMDTIGTQLFAGGVLSGTIGGNSAKGLAVVDLATGTYVSPHPPALAGSDVIVNAIAAQPSTASMYVGGQFSNAGSLSCPVLCVYDTNAKNWNAPASGLSGTIGSMIWTSGTQLVIAGNFSINGDQTMMATYDTSALKYTAFTGASGLQGPIGAITAGDSQYKTWFVAGTSSTNGSTYLAKYNNGAWTTITGLGGASSVRGLQVLQLTDNHADTDLVPGSEALLITGNINIPSYGNASAVLFNGTDYQPLALTSKSDGGAGTIANIFVSNPSGLMQQSSNNGGLAWGYVVLISFFIALVCTAVTLCVILLMELWHKRREWHARNDFNQARNMDRVPPEALLKRMGYSDTPKI